MINNFPTLINRFTTFQILKLIIPG